MHDHPPTPIETLRQACEIGRKAGLRYVYEGNVPGDIVVERDGFHFYLLLTTSILASLLLSLVVWLFRR
jgi:hypothetical protein